MRPKAMRSPLGSTTATFIAQPRLVASSTAALISACARSIEIGAPKGILNGIFSGMAFRSGGAVAQLAPAALSKSLTCGKQAGRQRQYSQSTRLHLGLLPYRRRLFGRCHDLRRKKAARASEVRALAPRLLRFPRLAAGQQNNLSTMRAKKRTRCATGRHRHFCRCLRGVAPAFAPRRACDHRGGDRRRRAVSPQAVDVTCKTRRREGRCQKQRLKNERPGPEGAGPGPF